MIRALAFNIVYYIGTVVIGVLILPSLLLPDRLYLPFIRQYFRWVYLTEKYILGLDYVVVGRENLPVGTPYIVAAKHQSAYETLKLPLLFDHPVVIMKRELLTIPFWGWYAAKAGNIGIDRNNARAALAQMTSGIIFALGHGRTPVIFPQGTRVDPHDTTNKPYKRGIAEFYAQSNAAVMPMAVNSGLFWPKNAFWKRGGIVTIEFLPAIPPGLNADEFMTRLQTTLETRSAELVTQAEDNMTPRKKRHPADVPMGIAAAIIIIYTALWFSGSWVLQSHLNDMWASSGNRPFAMTGMALQFADGSLGQASPNDGPDHTNPPFIMTGATPYVTGFPTRYRINWSGAVVNTQTNQVMYTIPSVTISFWPVPGTNLILDLPRGIQSDAIKARLQSFQMVLQIPTQVPQRWTKSEIQKLHDQNTVYHLPLMKIMGLTTADNHGQIAPVNLVAHDGQLWLDEALQPTGQVEIVLTPVEDIKNILMALAGSHPMGRSFIGGALDTLTQVDLKTGEKILPLTFKLQNGKMYAGPIQVGYIGHQYWPVDDPRVNGAPVAFPARISPPRTR